MQHSYLSACLFAFAMLSLATAHPHHGETRAVTPASGHYQLMLPATWYDSRRFDEPVQDEGDKLYLAETETIFEAWRDGRVIGPILQVTSVPLAEQGENAALAAEEVLRRALGKVPQGRPEPGRLGGNPSLTLRGLPYRDAPFAALTVTLVDDTLFYLLYAADRALHFREIEEVAHSFKASKVARTASPAASADATGATLEALVGHSAPNFTARLLDGGEVSLAALRGETVLVNFWATMCYGCQEEMRLLERLSEKRGDVQVLSVNWRDAPGLIRQFMERYDLSLPVALDRTGLVSDRYHVEVFPATVVIGAGGVVRAAPQFEMGMTLAEVEGWLEFVEQPAPTARDRSHPHPVAATASTY